MKRLLHILSAGAAVLLLNPGASAACGFHGYMPQETAIDRMLGSEHIILARTDPDNPFRFAAVEAIRGSVDGVDIPLLVDTQTRRRLRGNPQDTVLFARDGAYGPWVRLAYLDPPFRAVIDRVVPLLDLWAFEDEQARFQFFADLLHHPNRDVGNLVLAELDRAPYEVFDRLDMAPDAGLLLAGFNDPTRMASLPIRVLLLGKSPDQAARDALRRRFSGASLPSGAIAGAYAVALIEIDGADGADRVAAALRAGSMPTPETRETLVEALAIHSLTGEPALHRHIHLLVDQLLRDDPAYAGVVARQFGRRGDWSQADRLSTLSEAGQLLSSGDRFEVDQYLAVAAEARALAGN